MGKYVALKLLCRRLYQNIKVIYHYNAKSPCDLPNLKVRICKADFPKVGAVRHEMVRPVLSCMVHSLTCYIHVLETGMSPYERNKKMLWLSGYGSMLSLPLPTAFGEGAMGRHSSWFLPLRSPACPHGRDFLRAHPFLC